MASLKSLPDNFNVWFFLRLAIFDLVIFSHSTCGFPVLSMTCNFLLHSIYFVYYIKRLLILFKSSILVDSCPVCSSLLHSSTAAGSPPIPCNAICSGGRHVPGQPTVTMTIWGKGRSEATGHGFPYAPECKAFFLLSLWVDWSSCQWTGCVVWAGITRALLMLVWIGPLGLSYGMKGNEQGRYDHPLELPLWSSNGIPHLVLVGLLLPQSYGQREQTFHLSFLEAKGGYWVSGLHDA